MPRIAKTQALTSPALTPPTLVSPIRLFAGTSGWAYPTWKPGFYPAATPARRFLEVYASRLSSVEVNYTFRTLPTAAMVEDWLAATPAHFRFSFKAPQRITHFSRLEDCEEEVAEFLAAIAPIRHAGRLGLLLFQLPPNFKADNEKLHAFLSLSIFGVSAPLLLAFEFRHESWFAEATYDVLRRYDAALCIAESDDLATPEIHTATNYTCYRLRRSGGYSKRKINDFAKRFTALATKRDVYVYFKHEDEPTGALNASEFLARSRSIARTLLAPDGLSSAAGAR